MTDKARVLVVEDDPDIGDVVRRSLRREGYDVRLAADGSKALDEAAVFEPDAVVLDLGLPKVDGIEVSKRLRADGDVPLLRRRPPRGSASLVVGDLKLNPATHEAARGDRVLELTAREFELLEFMMRNERLVVSRDKLLEEVWGYAPFSETNTVDVFVSKLRRKRESEGAPRVLHAVRGPGYVMRAP